MMQILQALYAACCIDATPLSLSSGFYYNSAFVFGLVAYAAFHDANNQKYLLVRPCEGWYSV